MTVLLWYCLACYVVYAAMIGHALVEEGVMETVFRGRAGDIAPQDAYLVLLAMFVFAPLAIPVSLALNTVEWLSGREV